MVDCLAGSGIHADGVGFATWLYTAAAPMSLPALREVIRALPAAVYRCKGFVPAEEDPEARFVIQSVGRRSTVASVGP